MRQKLAILTSTIAEFATAARTNQLANATVGEWGQREVLAHITWWHGTYIDILWAMITGHRHPLTGDTKTFHAYNEDAIEQFHFSTPQQLADMLVKENEEFVSLAEKLSPLSIFEFKPGARQVPLETAIVQITAHIHNHLRALQRAAREQLHQQGRQSF